MKNIMMVVFSLGLLTLSVWAADSMLTKDEIFFRNKNKIARIPLHGGWNILEVTVDNNNLHYKFNNIPMTDFDELTSKLTDKETFSRTQSINLFEYFMKGDMDFQAHGVQLQYIQLWRLLYSLDIEEIQIFNPASETYGIQKNLKANLPYIEALLASCQDGHQGPASYLNRPKIETHVLSGPALPGAGF